MQDSISGRPRLRGSSVNFVSGAWAINTSRGKVDSESVGSLKFWEYTVDRYSMHVNARELIDQNSFVMTAMPPPSTILNDRRWGRFIVACRKQYRRGSLSVVPWILTMRFHRDAKSWWERVRYASRPVQRKWRFLSFTWRNWPEQRILRKQSPHRSKLLSSIGYCVSFWMLLGATPFFKGLETTLYELCQLDALPYSMPFSLMSLSISLALFLSPFTLSCWIF